MVDDDDGDDGGVDGNEDGYWPLTKRSPPKGIQIRQLPRESAESGPESQDLDTSKLLHMNARC